MAHFDIVDSARKTSLDLSWQALKAGISSRLIRRRCRIHFSITIFADSVRVIYAETYT